MRTNPNEQMWIIFAQYIFCWLQLILKTGYKHWPTITLEPAEVLRHKYRHELSRIQAKTNRDTDKHKCRHKHIFWLQSLIFHQLPSQAKQTVGLYFRYYKHTWLYTRHLSIRRLGRGDAWWKDNEQFFENIKEFTHLNMTSLICNWSLVVSC